MSTFSNPNQDLILDDLGLGPKATEDVILDEEVDPLMASMPKSAKDYIAAFNEEEAQAQRKKEDLAREAYRNWQAQQSDWVAFTFKGYTKDGKKVWEKRTYRIHDLIQDQTDRIQELVREIEDLETRKNYLQYMATRSEENLQEWTASALGKEIDKKVREIRNLRFELYFGETNPGILDKMRSIDVRDLIDAAVSRENKLPLSRKRLSSHLMSGGNTSPDQDKKSQK
jgi:hypothetical protein